MDAKKSLLQATRKKSQQKEVERMSEAEAAELLRSLNAGEGKKEK